MDVLSRVQDKTGRDMASIFAEVVDASTQTIPIRKFVDEIVKLDKSVDNEKLYQFCRVLDREGKEQITLDDFISFTEMVTQENNDAK
jgi:transcription initiation factor TFIIIB Brf1 subunit/transcription initiation factor TFIIB